MGIAEPAVESAAVIGVDEHSLGGALALALPPAVEGFGAPNQVMRYRIVYLEEILASAAESDGYLVSQAAPRLVKASRREYPKGMPDPLRRAVQSRPEDSVHHA